MKKLALTIGALALPLVSFAQDTNLGNFTSIATAIGKIVNILIPVAFALAILFFFWGVASYIFGGEHDKDVAKKRMLWGVIAIFVMASIWSIVTFLGKSLGLGPNTQPTTNVDLPDVSN